MQGIRLYILGGILVVALIFLQYHLWFKADGMRDLFSLKKKLALQVGENQKLIQRNKELLFQIERLENSQDAAEARARNELGMIKKGKVFYQVVK